MWRSLIYFVWLAIFVAVAVWLANWNGRVFLDLPPYKLDLWYIQVAWPGVEIDTSIGVLVLALVFIALVVAVLYRLWGAFRRVPRAITRHTQESRRQRGFKALSHGMTAVAAGDADEARRWSRKAEALIDEPPLTLLLSAQTAQLNGDEQAAKRYFEAMLEREETRFMGLRGLVRQALNEGDRATALKHLRQAYQLRPKTPWVLTAMIEAAEAGGELETAEQAIKQAAKVKALPAAEADAKRAVVLVEQAENAMTSGQRPRAVKLLREAHKLAPSLVPATDQLANMLLHVGQRGQAAKIIERSWAAQPHPALAATYGRAKAMTDKLKYLPQLRKMVSGAPSHRQSLITLAEAALEAELWGEARRYLTEAAEAGATVQICRLMAQLEEAEHGDADKAREWLLRAGTAASDPTWVCKACGAQAEDWTPHCGACDAFASLAWQEPPRAQSQTPAVLEAPAPSKGNGEAAVVVAEVEPAPPTNGGQVPPSPEVIDAEVKRA